MKYKVESNKNQITIKISEAEGKQKKLLEAFQECKEGRCTCPTQEYSKLDSLDIENNENTIHLKLISKSGEQFDEKEISKCMEYTKGKLVD